ncbi:hypothetical protein KFL_000020030 [Klebsormidium nitens]|uniref:Protein SPIRAL1-like 1 n=1 Tax=Klebsormidium nitens TaxID=105231 RepID=A0A1Y1HJA5_KLENI|nr:hypothetical protein KFL_000020030 [Klebsormidium nitens]|eukprot:GAQ77642.1 hypothetical protein KFL_000020030 [Klebsormidium nitens]
MGRGQMSGGGSSQLSYLFGDSNSEQAPATTSINPRGRAKVAPPTPHDKAPVGDVHSKSLPVDSVKDAANTYPAPDAASLQTLGGGNTQSKTSVNNYHRADGQNVNNFLTDRPSTRVVAAPGGNSQLNFLFGG